METLAAVFFPSPLQIDSPWRGRRATCPFLELRGLEGKEGIKKVVTHENVHGWRIKEL